MEYIDPRTRLPFQSFQAGDGNVPYPTVDGIPVLTLEPRALLARIPRNSPFPDIKRSGVPDPITPHLAASMLGAPNGLGAWFKELGDLTPEAVAAGFAARHAPQGPALDVLCGVGAMTRRMIATGRETWAFDNNPDAVAFARGILCGTLTQVLIPTHQGGLRRVRVPFRPITQGLNFCIAEPTTPPFPSNSFAWVHINTGLDTMGDSFADVLVASADLLVPGGTLTLSTTHSYHSAQEENAIPAEEELLEAVSAVGLKLIDQKERVPSIRRDFDRSFHISLVHCVAARK